MAGNLGNPAGAPANIHQIASLLPKLYEDDPDLRFMGLNDLHKLLLEIGPNVLANDQLISAKTVDGLLATLQDNNGEVQNMAIKCLGPFVNRVSTDQILCPMIDKISTLNIGDAVDNSIPALALRTIVLSLPRPASGVPRSHMVTAAYSAISRTMIPRLTGAIVIPHGRKDLPKPPKGMLHDDMDRGTDSNAIDVLTEVARCYGPMLQEAEVTALVKVSLEVLQHERTTSVLKKKAVNAISALAPYMSDSALSQFVSRIIELMRGPHLINTKRKLYINLLGAMARAVPSKFGKYLKTIAPFVLTALSQQEIDDDLAALEETEERDPEADDVREAALIALESFLRHCSQDMRLYTRESIEAITRFLKYDPNLADEDEDMEEMEEEDAFDEDGDFEEEASPDDEDDTSWKVRRCAAKVADVFVETRSCGDLLDDGTLYEDVAPVLVARFKEREEGVRVEVISALARLIRSTAGSASFGSFTADPSTTRAAPPTTRKRRRDSSTTSTMDQQLAMQATAIKEGTPPPGSAKAKLELLSSQIVVGAAQLMKTMPLPTKQAAITLMKDLTETLQGRLSDYLEKTVDPVLDAVRSSGAGSAAVGSQVASANIYRTEALHYLAAIATSQTSKSLQPYLGKIVLAVTAAMKDRYTKVSIAALEASEAYVKTLTTHGAVASAEDASYIKQIYEALSDRITIPDVDTDVRKLSIRVLGTLLGRASHGRVFGANEIAAGLELLLSRSKNELTRLSSVRAMETVALLVGDPDFFPPGWVSEASIELGPQLRKASRVLRGSSLQTLKELSLGVSSVHITSETVQQLMPMLLPILLSGDLHLISSDLVILNAYAQKDANAVVTQEFMESFGELIVKTPISGATLDNLLALTQTIGEKGVGKALMTKLLADISLKANSELVGKVIGNLLVTGGPNIGVKLDDFINEAKAKRDEKRKCLALAVLGEAGLRLGEQSPLQPSLFINFFNEKSDRVPLAAAVALGRAAAGNIPTYLPVILQTMGRADTNQYLLLHSVREVLQQESTESHILPHAGQLWDNLLAASKMEDNRAIGAECIGRLAVLDPATYLPQLQTFLIDRDASTRGMVISALRFTFGDTGESYDSSLGPIIIGMLQTMLKETDLENQRLALTTLSSAAQHKPNLVVAHLGDLLPLCMKETKVRPELIREVQMGPFKHKVDDGLEIRKSAFETIYSLLDMAFPLLDIETLYARLISGLTDDHDIRDLCTLMLNRLIHLAPSETAARLDDFVEPFKTIVGNKPKDTAIKQEVERIQEESKHVVRLSLTLAKRWPDETADLARAWGAYCDLLRKEYNSLVKQVEEEAKEKER